MLFRFIWAGHRAANPPERRNLRLKYALDKVLAVPNLMVLLSLYAVISLALSFQGLVSAKARGPVIIATARISQGRPAETTSSVG